MDILGHVPGLVTHSFVFVSFLYNTPCSLIRNSGFPGFFVAGVFSGALSTVSGGKQFAFKLMISITEMNLSQKSAGT